MMFPMTLEEYPPGEWIHIPPNGKRKIIFKMHQNPILLGGYVTSLEGSFRMKKNAMITNHTAVFSKQKPKEGQYERETYIQSFNFFSKNNPDV